MFNYWLVGATFGDDLERDVLPEFIELGYWEMDWDDRDQPAQTDRRSQLRVGDFLAVKRLKGQGAKEMDVLAIGVITAFNASRRVAFVKWLDTHLNHSVALKGCVQAINGPFSYSDDADRPWIREVFGVLN